MKTLVILVAVTLVTVCTAKKNCLYKRSGKWSECVDGKETLSKVLEDGSDETCKATKTKTRKCVPGRKEKCKYKKGNWSDCDVASNMQTRTMTLHKGSLKCAATKTKTRKCKKGCKYIKGTWSECNPVTKKMSRTLTLEQGGSHCMPTKTREKRCKKAKKSSRKRTTNVKLDTPASSSALSSGSPSVPPSSASPPLSVPSISHPNNHPKSKSRRKQSTSRKKTIKTNLQRNRHQKMSQRRKTKVKQFNKQKKVSDHESQTTVSMEKRTGSENQAVIMTKMGFGASSVGLLQTTLRSSAKSHQKDMSVSMSALKQTNKARDHKVNNKPNKAEDPQDKAKHQPRKYKDKQIRPQDETSDMKPNTEMTISTPVAIDATTAGSWLKYFFGNKADPKGQIITSTIINKKLDTEISISTPVATAATTTGSGWFFGW